MATWFQLGLADFTVVGLIGILTGAIGGWFSKYLFPKLLQDRKHALEVQSETHRFQLKRQELLFEREFAAVEQLFELYETTLGHQAGPYDDDPDYYGSIVAPTLGELDEKLTEMIKKHGAVFSDGTLALLRRARSAARLGFTSYCEDMSHSDQGPDYSLSDSLMENLRELAAQLDNARVRARIDLATGSLAKAQIPG